MKKIYRASQRHKIIGKRVSGPDRHLFGLPYDGASGVFLAQDPDAMDLMFAAAEKYYPEIHIISMMLNGYVYNRYVEKADGYFLCRGNTDPDLEFTNEWSDDDFTPEELARNRRLWEENLKAAPTAADIAAVNWMIQKHSKPKKSA